MWRAYAVSWYLLWTNANAGNDCWTRKYSNEAVFTKTTLTQILTGTLAWRGTWFGTNSKSIACWCRNRLPLLKASPGDLQIELEYAWRYSVSSHVTSGIYSLIVNYKGLSLVQAICGPNYRCVRFFEISVTELWDLIFHRCVWTGRKGPGNVVDSKAGWYTARKLDIDLPVTVTLVCKMYTKDNVY